MSQKLSKKDQDPKMVEESAKALAELAKIKSQHFEVGSRIIVPRNRAGMIIERSGDTLVVLWDDDDVPDIIRPIALSWRCDY